METFSRLWKYLVEFFSECEIFQTKIVKTIKIQVLCSVTLIRRSCRLWDNVEKFGGAREAAGDDMAAHFVLD
jgi:hypothetical protein